MKLKTISESRRPAEYVNFFHGVIGGRNELISILNHGLLPRPWIGRELDLKTLLKTVSDKDARSFFTRSVELALTYAEGEGGIIEIIANINNNQFMSDEDAIDTSAMPSTRQGDTFTAAPYEEWEEYFAGSLPKLPEKERKQMWQLVNKGHDALMTREWKAFLRHIARYVDKPKDQWREGETTGTYLNAMYNRPIGLKGRIRIVGAYLFTENTAGDEWQCSEVLYNRGGTISLGDRYEEHGDWWQ
jgi:hypothetical protein